MDSSLSSPALEAADQPRVVGPSGCGTLGEELTAAELFVRFRPRFRHVSREYFARVCRAAVFGGAPLGTRLSYLAGVVGRMWESDRAIDQPTLRRLRGDV